MENSVGHRGKEIKEEIKELRKEIKQEEHLIKEQEKRIDELEDQLPELIIVNAQPKTWCERTISYEQVIVLAFEVYDNAETVIYSVSYSKGPDKKPEGILDKGDSVKVKNKMRFHATKSNRS